MGKRKTISDGNSFMINLKETIKEQIDEEFTRYKLMCLDNLKFIIESKRNEVVKGILDNISISMAENGLDCLEPTIQIKIVKAERRDKDA